MRANTRCFLHPGLRLDFFLIILLVAALVLTPLWKVVGQT